MLLKKKRNLLFASCLVGLLATTSATTVALSSCSTTTSSSSSDVQYSYVIDWNNEAAVERLTIDSNGLVYSDSSMTTIIAVSPKVHLTTVKIPSKVKNIMGYSRVMYKDSSGTLYDQIPSGESSSSYTKVYQSYGAFQGMESLETIALESGSELESIGAAAFSGCISLKNVNNLSNSLKYIGANAFINCTNLQSIDISNVIKVDDYAFSGCTSLSTVDLSNTLSIGSYAFQNCSSLTALGSLEQVRTMGQYAFYGATKSDSNIELKISNLKTVPNWAFNSAKGITTVDFSNNTLLTTISDNAFMNSSITEVNFDGCSNLENISERVFENCTNLTAVYLPANSITSLTSLGYNTFMNCSNLTTVGVKGTSAGSFVATSKLSNTGANFLANTAITTVNLASFIPNNSSDKPFGSLASLAFIPNLTTVTLPSNLTILNAGLFYGSGLSSTSGFSLTLPSSITNIVYSASIEIPNANNSSDNTTKMTVNNATPFTNSGIASIDMSSITSYQTTNTTVIPDYLFNEATKLTSVILKTDTTEIGTYAFADTTALTSISYPSSSSTTTTNGFTASNTLTTIDDYAFKGAFSDSSNATVDLSEMSELTTTPAAFNESNVVTLKLPTSIETIAANSFDNMTKLATVNFGELTNLTSIVAPNFNNTKLTSIDLSNVTSDQSMLTTTSDTTLFNGLPTTCVVSLPSTFGSFSDIFMDTEGNPVTFNYPNGLSLNDTSNFVTVTNGVLGFVSTTQQQLNNIGIADLSSNTTIHSIGPNTFFGNGKLSSITLPAKGISQGTAATLGLFSTTQSITANANNKDAASAQYVKANIPFGNNTSFTSLNYTGFTSVSSSVESNTPQETLFNTTDQVAWAEIGKIINSLSYQASPSSNEVAAAIKPNMSQWVNVEGTVTNEDVTNAFTAATSNTSASVQLTNLHTTDSASTYTTVTISATDETKSFIHNGVTWTYTNNGSSITLTGTVNMYKLVNGSNKYLVFFNQKEYVGSGSTNTYYVPSDKSVSVTLTVATTTTSTSK